MVSKEPFKVHSLKKHIEETTGFSANSRTKPAARPSIKDSETKATGIFGNNDSESDSSSSSSSDDSDDDGAAFLKALKSRKAKTAGKTETRPSKNEEIADSDVERSAAASKSKHAKKAATQSKAKPDSDSDDSSSEDESDEGEKKVRVNGTASKSKASSTSATSPTSSSGSDSDSGSSSGDSSSSGESESESESEDESEAVPAKPSQALRKTSSSESSSDESESESEEEARPTVKPKSTPGVDGKKAKPVTTSESDDSSSDEEEADKTIEITERPQLGQASLPRFMPPDFELRKSDPQSNAEDVARVCSEAYLQGKQLWYFTLPANVPVSVVDMLEFPVDKSLQGDSVLSHDGQDYDVSFGSAPATKSVEILVPSANGSKYQSSRRTVNEVLQVRRIAKLGATTATPANVGSSKKVARPQPKGLKARFQPIGVHSDMGTIGLADGDHDADVEMADAPVASAAKPAATPGKEKKAKASAPATATATGTPKEASGKSKKGKRKHSASEDEDAAAAEQLMEESVTAQTKTKTKKAKTASTGSPDLGSEPVLPTPKPTFIVPPPIPGSSGTVPAASTPVKKSSKTKHTPGSSQATAQSKKETPVPVPAVPGLAQTAAAAAANTPTQKKSKARKEKKATSAESLSS